MARPKLNERLKVDVGLIPQTINNNNATGDYYDVRGWEKIRAIVMDGASVVNKTTKVEFLQATDAAGTGAKVVKQSNASTGTESSATSVAAAAKLSAVTECTVALSSAGNGETLTITDTDGTDYVFTGHTDTTTASKREFAVDGNDTQDCTALVGLINHATYGVPGITAVDGGAGAMTLKVSDKGEGTFSVATSTVTHFVPAITKQVLISEVDVLDLDLSGGFYYVAVKITKAGNGIVGAVLERTHAQRLPEQAAAASTVL